ncbi:MAG: phosphate transporter substrate-binding protein [Ramlibacter sp.]|nr:phosphate transporter substrate-binding protein [Ramlibacter sp.]
MKCKQLLAAALLGAGLCAPAAADIYVIANAALALSPEEVRDAYLGDKQIAGGTKLVPLDNAAQQKEFLERALKIDAAKYNSIWIKKGFRDGLNAPAVKAGDAEVIAAVKATPGAVGYVSAAPKDLKVIAKY